MSYFIKLKKVVKYNEEVTIARINMERVEAYYAVNETFYGKELVVTNIILPEGNFFVLETPEEIDEMLSDFYSEEY